MMDKFNRKKETESHKLAVKSLDSLSFRSFMDISQHSWGVKDLESRFVYMNEVAFNVNNLPIGFDFEGRLDSECPADWAKFAPEFQKQDRETEKNKKNVAVISTQYHGREQRLEPYYEEKSPLYNEADEVIGTIWCARKFNFFTLSQYINKLTPSVLVLDPPTDIFTEIEIDTVFYLQKSLSRDQIAEKLGISPCEIDKHKSSIFQKADVHSMDQFKEFCESTGFNRYIPKKFIQPSVQFV